MRVARSYRARFTLSTALVVVTSIGPVAAVAQEGSEARPSGEEGRERALVLFEAAELRYQEARFEEAVELLVEARSLFDEAVISYNLGRAYEELERWSEAAEAFRHYLERAPDARDRRVVVSRIERLEARAASEPVAPDPPVDPPADPIEADPPAELPPDDKGVSVGAVITAAVGALVLGGGVAFGLASVAARDAAVDDPEHMSSRESFRDAETFATLANVSFVVGGVLAAAGLTWLFIDLAIGGESDDDEIEVALRLGPGSVAVVGALP